MSESLTIYECPECGTTTGHGDLPHPCQGTPVRVRVFREEDVRPLVEARNYALRLIEGVPGCTADCEGFRDPCGGCVAATVRRALDVPFPAPEDWEDWHG